MSFIDQIKQFLSLTFVLIPLLTFYIPMKLLLVKIIPKQREKALKKSSVKVKGNDVVQTLRIKYSIIIFPILLNFYGLFFFLFTCCYLKLGFLFSLRLQIDFLFWIPVYLYFAMNLVDKQFEHLKIIWFRLKLYLLFKKNYKEQIKMLFQQRSELQSGIQDLFNNSEIQSQFKDLLEDRVIKQEQMNYEKVDNIVKSISEKFVNIF